jgi:hypothetical protein
MSSSQTTNLKNIYLYWWASPLTRCLIQGSLLAAVQQLFSYYFSSPNVVASVGNLTHLPFNESYKGKSEDPCDHFYSPVSFKYMIDGTEVTLDLMAVDNVFLDLTPKRTRVDVTSND